VQHTAGDDVFLFNTLTDAVVVVSEQVFDACVVGRPPDRIEAGDAQALHEAGTQLREMGFLVDAPEDDDRALSNYLAAVRDSRDELCVTVLTTLRCNLSCRYCVQGDHSPHAPHMTPEGADAVGEWLAARLDVVQPARLVVTFFGGEPLLNVPALERVASHAHRAATGRGIDVSLAVITNGVLLSRALVDRLLPLGLRTVKVTLDGDAGVHDRLRPTRGGRGSFDVILENLRAIAGTCRISIGGNLTVASADACLRLMDLIAAEPFRPSLGSVSFKPVVPAARREPPLTAAGGSGSVPSRGHAACDTCDTRGLSDERWAWLREQAAARGLPVPDGVHMGPCEIHRRHSYTVGPDGRLYACPGYAGLDAYAVGHIARAPSPSEEHMLVRRSRLAAWRACGDCSFVPVCAGGCSVAGSSEHGDMEAPACHKPAFEAAVASMARNVLSGVANANHFEEPSP
jgi:uncharacterized protein